MSFDPRVVQISVEYKVCPSQSRVRPTAYDDTQNHRSEAHEHASSGREQAAGRHPAGLGGLAGPTRSMLRTDLFPRTVTMSAYLAMIVTIVINLVARITCRDVAQSDWIRGQL